MQEGEATGIPEFVGEAFVFVQLLFSEANILIAFDAHRCEPKAVGIGTIFGDHIERINSITLRLRHTFAVSSLYDRVHQDMLERYGLEKLHRHEDHSRYPEIDDFAGSGKYRGWIEEFQFFCILRPA
ncbi:MAG: hypothetical protein BWY75_00414 [bacterium ADurb.Bin425]|nr:MAG: hypothetical protein BWY75_00414 [bacterium ADurb.Bin425]